MGLKVGYSDARRNPSRNGSGKTPRELAQDKTDAKAEEAAKADNNLQAKSVEEFLTRLQAKEYTPNLPVYFFRDENFDQLSFWYDVEAMLRHDCITTPLDYVKSPINQMQIQVDASSTKVLKFILSEWDRWKQMYQPKVQDSSYPYGWMGGEPVYKVEGGLLIQGDFKDFSPRDVRPLVLHGEVVGIQVSNVSGGSVNLPGAVKGYPAKGFWYSHRPRYGSIWGQSQIRSAWKPWRRLAGRDGVEEVTDLDCYRAGTGVVIMGAPLEDTKAKHQTPGLARQPARDVAQELVENLKGGAGIVLPTTVDEHGNRKWTLDFESPKSNLQWLLDADKALYVKCSKAIGFPPELLEAAETGSGWSGRMVPLEAFLISQQPVAQGLFFAWFQQIGLPLVWWNYGKKAWVRATVVPLIKSHKSSSMPQPGQPGGGGQAAPSMPGKAGGAAETPEAGGGKPEAARFPYLGPRGGKGYRDAVGRIHYTANFSTRAVSYAYDEACRIVERALDGGNPDEAIHALAKVAPDLEPDEVATLIQAIELSEESQAMERD